MTPLETVLAQLERLGCQPRKSGSGWLALCPYHELDGGKHRPSLAVAQTQDGKALLRCFANCPTELVLERLDLRWQDLWPDSVRPKVLGNGQSTTKPADGNGQAGKSYPTVEAALTDLQRSLGRPTGLWPYHNTAGELVGLVCRFGLPGGEKSYRPLTPCQDGWRIAAMKEPRPLYRLSDLLAADPRTPVVVCEGEKAAEAALLCGLLATTSSGGAQAAAKTDWTPLAGRNVIILPDNDEAGLQYAQGVARLALEAGAASVKIVRLSDYCPLLPEHGDIADVLADPAWCGACLGESATPEDLGRLILQWASKTPEVPRPGPVILNLADVQPEAIQWLWPDRFPLGKVSLLVGMPGGGKSLLTIDIAARLSRGLQWPDGAGCPEGDSLFIVAEDGLADTVRPRAEAAEARLERIHVLEAIQRVNDGEIYKMPVCLTCIEEIAQAMKQVRPRLVVLDPIGHFLPVDVDVNAENHVRQVLGRLAELAAEFETAIVLVAHRRKARADFADDVVLGSRGFVGLARAVWHVCRDGEDETRRLLVPGKNNLAGPVSGLGFRIVSENGYPRLEWDSSPVLLTASQAIARELETTKETQVAAAEKALILALSGGPKANREVLQELTRQGFSEKTIQRAKTAAGVRSVKTRFGGVWEWKLPDELCEPPTNEV
ncbi:MAG TPA: AAA family ATPase [Thermoguttaceae bacterium]|nr:AAA family ATPase [Thermoguttaceae bacterium]